MKRILVIEDEHAYQKLLHDQLIKNGYEVVEAIDGKEGLILAKVAHPDLILLDIKMPVLDGIKMLTELRKDPYGKLAKVIILTNIEPSSAILKKVLEDLPSSYFIKSDIQFTELLAKIKEFLGE